VSHPYCAAFRTFVKQVNVPWHRYQLANLHLPVRRLATLAGPGKTHGAVDKRLRRLLGNTRLNEAAQDAAVACLLRFVLARRAPRKRATTGNGNMLYYGHYCRYRNNMRSEDPKQVSNERLPLLLCRLDDAKADPAISGVVRPQPDRFPKGDPMPDYAAASRTKDNFEAQLFQEHPEVVSIAPRPRLDPQGVPTNDAVIVIGIKQLNPLRIGPGGGPRPQPVALPTQLPVIDAQGNIVKNEAVEVIIEDEGEILAEMFTAKRRPCPGGYSIGHPRVTAGTLGGVARVGSTWGYILSNNHVIAATNSGAVGDAIYQPGVYDGGGPGDTIGHLERWVPIVFGGGNNEADCAFAKALDPWDQHVTRHVETIGTPAAQANATVGQAIRKSGRTTQPTTGSIVSDNASIQVSYGAGLVARFVNQLQYTRMSAGGDSGALIWDRDSLTVLGLNFAGSSAASYGNKILRVLALLSQARTVHGADGVPTHFPSIDLGLIDTP